MRQEWIKNEDSVPVTAHINTNLSPSTHRLLAVMQLCYSLAKLGQPGHLLRNPITFGDLMTEGFAGLFGLMGLTFRKIM